MAKGRRKVLIVEDHSLNLKLFRDILRAKGFDTLEDRGIRPEPWCKNLDVNREGESY